MYSTILASGMLALAAIGASAKPTPVFDRSVDSDNAPSFNNYLGLSQMSNFDDFFGQDNFGGFSNTQTVVEQSTQLVCDTKEIAIVQQRLAVLVEVAKKVVLTQLCEVEVQTVVIQQVTSSITNFGNVVGRSNSKGQVSGFDQSIAGLLGQIMGQDGQISSGDLGFNGTNIGNQTVQVSGDNWNDATSPASVKSAQDMAKQAANITAAQAVPADSVASEKRWLFNF